ncbi:3-dehydroquinate synthase [Thermoflexus sp.]|uniref:3-dehydroquinate synthase n=1 Tax=Thermoflexus sp. TaxID=1969742 RepID=UPI0025F10006|nr:3-dehydroquinate synthase [Thermoflexus sp.]MDW8180488.1 3-dehydroquinate synthase [Anaerolineae bacterium]MCS6963364.1 3-dehydroquinate synthase [Thermoflexus sp.]MCS7351035.1 3-dehydroquinate synthase [Thermoflexus sp.]MCX7690523.1 3-dehydroquinate synthase [Thermoflexus sp.]MDW8184512.1 3-dehydroquinate synthase [Anaerolineae bacterium]
MITLHLRFPEQEHSHPIWLSTGLLDRCGAALREAGLEGAVALVSDTTVAADHGARARRSLEEAGFSVLEIHLPPGEGTKTLDTAAALYRRLAQGGIGRDGILVGLGGGVVLDLAGFVAATYMRGIAFVSIPTTLLAMVDASIGGKTGVDLPEGKNLVGAFYPPRLLLIDPMTLRTLPPAEWRNGMAEVVKAALIGDPALWQQFQRDPARWAAMPEGEPLLDLLTRAIAVKVRVVEQDPLETRGEREVLNLGHTFGHAFERVSGYRVPHGEAVAAGMVAAAALSARLGLLEDVDLPHHLERVLEGIRLPTRWRAWLARYGVDATPEQVIAAMGTDKKRRGGRLRFVVIQRPGAVRVYRDASYEAVYQALEETAHP